MPEKDSLILILAAFAAIGLLCLGFIVILVIYRNRKLLHAKETTVLAENHRQEILMTQLQSQVETMQHIGSEIHDNVGQKLTLASLYAKQLTTGKEISDANARINMIGNIIDESLADLRQLSKSLTNPEAANAGLIQMINEEAQRINVSGVCFLSVTGNEHEINLPQAEKNILFRLLQEFIQNSLKHANCRKINIDFSNKNNRIFITATDDGKGFDLSIASNGIGLQNMKRRAAQINAGYRLESAAGKGTTLNIELNRNK